MRAYADVIHSVDRSSLVDALASEESTIDCFVQVNLTADESRGGATPARLAGLVDEVLAAPGLRLLGLMAVAPLDEDPRRAFAHVRALSERIQRQAPARRSRCRWACRRTSAPPSSKGRHTFESAPSLPGIVLTPG